MKSQLNDNGVYTNNTLVKIEKDAIRDELNKAMKGIIDQYGVREHATMLYFMRLIMEEYSQLDLF